MKKHALPRQYLIWSEEHGAWWRPGKLGYTSSIKMAGRYNFERAMEIEANANQMLDIEAGQFNEVAIPDPLPL